MTEQTRVYAGMFTFIISIFDRSFFFLWEICYLYCSRELLLNQNFLRVLPYELGKLFQLQVLGLQGNPLSKDVMALYGNGEPAGTNKLLTYMLDNLQGR